MGNWIIYWMFITASRWIIRMDPRPGQGLKRCSALLGETRARQLLAHTQLSSLQPSSARPEVYPLVNVYIANWKMAIYSGFTH